MAMFTLTATLTFAQTTEDVYQCTPCGNECDKDTYHSAGKCKHCKMKLVKKSTVNFNTILPENVCTYVAEHAGVVLLDVRTKEEYDGTSHPEHGTLKNAINIPIQELENRMGELDKYKNSEIIVYCSHSKRSPRASQLLVQNGFLKVTNMAGGMSVMKNDECVVGRK